MSANTSFQVAPIPFVVPPSPTTLARNQTGGDHEKNPLSNWDSKSKLGDPLNETVVLLQHVCSERPIPQKFKDDHSDEHASLSHGDELLELNIENMQQFYEWFEELGEEDVEEEKFNERIETLKSYRDYCNKILDEIESAWNYLQDLENKYNLVAKKTGELHQACEALVQEQNLLLSFADNLDQKLAYFNELPKITAKFNSPTLTVFDPNFKILLSKLDECLEFVIKHRDFRDSENFLMKYKQLQNRGLSMLKNEIIQTLKTTTTQLVQQMKTATDTQQPKHKHMSNSEQLHLK